MNFFEHQAAARRMSSRLLLLFALAVAGIVAAVDAVAWLLTGSVQVVAFTSVATLAVIGFGSMYRIASLRGGGDAVALQMGGVPVPEDATDLNLRRLRNVVEEMADMISASRSFQINVQVVEAAKTLAQRVLALGQ